MSIKTILATILFALLITPAQANHREYCNRDEAELLATKAAEYYQKDEKRALASFQNKNSSFFYNDLYVFVIDDRGVFIAHGEKPFLIGKSGYKMRDIKGKTFIQDFLKIKTKGWVSYKWPDMRDEGNIKEKRSFIIRIKNKILGVGFFEHQ